MTNKIILGLVAGISLFCFAGLVNPNQPLAQDQESEQQELKSQARKMFMRGKLLDNQNIVEGLCVKNFELIQQGSEGVIELVLGQHWFLHDTAEYRKYSDDMTAAANRLRDAATSKNIEAAALRYFDLTLTCIDCHQYLETMQR